MSDLEAVVSAVSASKKYHSVCADAVRRIAERELASHNSPRAAVKATKRRLHQIYGAFESEVDYDAAYRQLENAYQQGLDLEIKGACRDVLALHSSTHERLSILDRFYPAIFEVTGRPSCLLDVGCGLNPLALPWMGLVLPQGPGHSPDVCYVALDIDANRVHFLNRYLELVGLEPLARCQDVLSHPPGDAADLALLFKLSPTLERQEAGATLRLIEQLRAPYVAVSFAVKSLGGRKKGMAEHYQQQFLAWIEDRRWLVEKLAFETELVFIVKREA